MKILLSFTLPYVVPNLWKFISYVEHKRRYFDEFWRAKRLLVPIDFHSRERNTMDGLPVFFQISSFMFNTRKKLIQVWNDMRVSKWSQKFHFWVNYSFKMAAKRWPEFWFNWIWTVSKSFSVLIYKLYTDYSVLELKLETVWDSANLAFFVMCLVLFKEMSSDSTYYEKKSYYLKN